MKKGRRNQIREEEVQLQLGRSRKSTKVTGPKPVLPAVFDLTRRKCRQSEVGGMETGYLYAQKGLNQYRVKTNIGPSCIWYENVPVSTFIQIHLMNELTEVVRNQGTACFSIRSFRIDLSLKKNRGHYFSRNFMNTYRPIRFHISSVSYICN